MKKTCLMSVVCMLVCGSIFAQSANPELDAIKWQKGPSGARIGSVAEIKLPEGYMFAGPEDTKKLMIMTQNPPSGKELGFIAPESLEWFFIFEFDESGYVKDDEKANLDAQKLLDSMIKQNDLANEQRKKQGWATLSITGWQTPPCYNETTHNLEWAIQGMSEGQPLVNFNTRILGREGVMRVTLVTSPAKLTSTLPLFKQVMSGFTYSQGHKYAEYKEGDKLAKYGLTALIAGGAAAVAVKSGLFKYIWKILVIGVIAVGAFFRKFFGKKQE